MYVYNNTLFLFILSSYFLEIKLNKSIKKGPLLTLNIVMRPKLIELC